MRLNQTNNKNIIIETGRGTAALKKGTALLAAASVLLCTPSVPYVYAEAKENVTVYSSVQSTAVINAADTANSSADAAAANTAESTGAAAGSLAGPTDNGIPEGISAEDYARLCDNTIEWDEIENIVKYRNPTYKTYSARVDESLGIMKDSVSADIGDLKDQLDSIDEAIDSIKSAQAAITSAGGSTAGTAYTKLSESLEQSKKLRESLKSGLNQMGSTSRSLKYGQKNSELSLAPLRYQLGSVIEGLIISYKTLEANRTMLSAQVSLYETLYGTYQSMQSQALATGSDTAGYQSQLDSARASLTVLDTGMAQLKGNILIQCGYAADADTAIAELPKADRNYLAGRDIDSDRKTAVDGNSSVISAAKLSGYSGDVLKYREMNENAAVSDASEEFDSIKTELERQLILCESSETSLKKAELMKNSADTKNALGMLGRGEYEGLRLQYIVAEATAAINELNLMQATENYKFALKGIM